MSFLSKKTPNTSLDLMEEVIPNFAKRFELMEEVMYGGSGQNIITRLDRLEKKVDKYIDESTSSDKTCSVANTENVSEKGEHVREESKVDEVKDDVEVNIEN